MSLHNNPMFPLVLIVTVDFGRKNDVSIGIMCLSIVKKRMILPYSIS